MILRICLLAFSLLANPLYAQADPSPANAPQRPQTIKQVTKEASPPKKTYEQWLQTYKVWDKLDEQLAESEQTEASILKQAQIAMQAGNPQHVLEILDSTPPFLDNNATESDRLWLSAQASRALGDPERAVFKHVQAAELMPKNVRVRRMRQEPGLSFIWKDVFRKLFQVYSKNSTISREAQKEYLDRMLGQASESWSSDIFWRSVQTIFHDMDADDAEASTDHPTLPTQISDDLVNISRAISGYSVGYPEANNTLIDVSDKNLQGFWFGLIDSIEHSDSNSLVSFSQELPSSRAKNFASTGYPPIIEQLSSSWHIRSSSKRYNDFINNTKTLSLSEMNLLFKEDRAESLMIGTVPAEELLPLQLALAIAQDDRERAASLWDQMDSVTLPSSLKLAGMLYFNYNFRDISRREPDFSKTHDQNWLTLLEAAGHKPPLPYLIPFWQPVDPANNRFDLIREWPLDLDVMLEVWKYDWAKHPDRNLARRITYLYPDDQFGMLCALYLADEALGDNQVPLSEYYLSSIDAQDTNSTLTAEYYRVNAELLMHKEDMDGAYNAYQQLVATGAPIDDTTRMKIAFLLQQRGELEAGREHLLKLWARKDEFSTAMQAEILFYLAEGEQAMGLSDQALDYYLQLAWKYPQESMWALTAMYRSATIYENRGQYDPAASLLKTVVKNAQTPKQREAAMVRLENIQAKQAKNIEHGTGTVPYPF